MIRFLFAIVLGVYLILPITAAADDRDYMITTAGNELKVMSYNVENLFDAQHDEGKNDYEFLPKSSPLKANCRKDFSPFLMFAHSRNVPGMDSRCLDTDWTDEKVELKLGQLKQVLDALGDLPDILTLAETENPNVVGRLAAKLGFDAFVMTDSPDERGIDTAILYRTKKLSLIEFNQREVQGLPFKTRNLSYAAFRMAPELGGGVLLAFPNHFPAQSHPSDTRVAVSQQLRAYVDETRKKFANDDVSFFMSGDFNVTPADSAQVIDAVLLGKDWDAGVADVHRLATQSSNPTLSEMPAGTFYYGRENQWDEFDRFMVSSNLTGEGGLKVDPTTYRINALSFASRTNRQGDLTPDGYNVNATAPENAGHSDHFSITMKLKYAK